MTQGTGKPDGFFARSELGSAANALLDHIEYKTITLSDSGKAALSDTGAVLGNAHIFDTTNGSNAIATLHGSSNSVTVAASGGADTWGTSEGTDTQVNVYWDSTNGQYEINNETGGEVTFEVVIIRNP